jgi:hypothetical protein
VRHLAAILGLLVMACGSSAVGTTQASPSASNISSPNPSSSPDATPTVTPSALASALTCKASKPPCSTLYAVLEAPGQYKQNNTVAIAGLDGYARAKTHFTPRSYPYVPDSAVVLAPEAHVAAGVVYFVDGRGVVRTLARSGRVRQVAAFPMTQSQQAISFAVSPDGKRLVAAILTLPSVGKTVPGSPWPDMIGPWKLEVDRADVGGPTITLHRWQSPTEPGCITASCPLQPRSFANIVIAGWDGAGPVAVVGSNYSTQNGVFDGQTFYGGHFSNVDVTTGLPGAMIGKCLDENAGPWSVGPDGSTACARWSSSDSGEVTTTVVTVESPGKSIWEPTQSGDNSGLTGSFVLSTDSDQLAMDGAVLQRSGSTLATNGYFSPQGWLDTGTLIGVQHDNADPNRSVMAYLHLSNPAQPVSLGFVGEFVGTIS